MSKFPNWIAGIALGAVGTIGFAYVNAGWMTGEAPRHAPAAPELPAALAGEAADSASADQDALGGLVSAAHAEEMPKAGSFGLGREALPEEIAAWDVNVMPDGRGLPEGSGSVSDGEALFSENCAACHGDFAEGVGNFPQLAGGEGTLADRDPVKTVGSYWPYLSTAWDYVHRSMPYGNAQSLDNDEVYAIVAYILYSNYLVEDDFVLSKDNFTEIEMPNADGFIVDDRPETEYPKFRAEPCMTDCKDEVKITMKATVLDVTPDEAGDGSSDGGASGDEASSDQAASDSETQVAANDGGADAAAAGSEAAAADAAPDPEMVAAGEKVFRKCQTCHAVGEGAKNKMGPQLNGVVGREVGSVKDYRYSSTFKDAHEAGKVWDHDALATFLADPRGTMKGTKMSFGGLKKEGDIDALIAYLSTQGD